MGQKKVLEVNPRHPIIKDLLRRINEDKKDETAIDMAKMMFRTATLRSGYMLQDTFDFADSIERMMRVTMGVSPDEPVSERHVSLIARGLVVD
jgi:heat shock protein beta